MPRGHIRVVPLGADDWVVREDGGRELGHYPSEQDAKSVASKLASKRNVDLLLDDQEGKPRSEHAPRGWLARLLGR
jgi:hypothetical protein